MIENKIVTFFHCGECLGELPAGESPRSYACLEVGATKDGQIQVWCKRHEMNVGIVGKASKAVRDMHLSCGHDSN